MRADRNGRLVVTHDRPQRGHDYPTLEEALDLMHGRIGVMIELKTPHRYRSASIVTRTVELMNDDDVLVCFQRAALVEARALRPGLRTVQHVGFGTSIRAADGAWAAGFMDGRVTRRGLAAARGRGLETLVYTVNEAARMTELSRLGVSGIFTDRPDLAVRLLR